ncbi:MAG TPA: hypothetical protein VG603_14450, partial [Chitinophagales bacterium]|nr:hypothetical protein [Chitinophagales bacterium]
LADGANECVTVQVTIAPSWTIRILAAVTFAMSLYAIFGSLFFGVTCTTKDKEHVNCVVAGVWILIFPAILAAISYFMKRGLRQSFETGMGLNSGSE